MSALAFQKFIISLKRQLSRRMLTPTQLNWSFLWCLSMYLWCHNCFCNHEQHNKLLIFCHWNCIEICECWPLADSILLMFPCLIIWFKFKYRYAFAIIQNLYFLSMYFFVFVGGITYYHGVSKSNHSRGIYCSIVYCSIGTQCDITLTTWHGSLCNKKSVINTW